MPIPEKICNRLRELFDRACAENGLDPSRGSFSPQELNTVGCALGSMLLRGELMTVRRGVVPPEYVPHVVHGARRIRPRRCGKGR